MSDIVKYHNQINEVNFSGYTEKELNMFFSLVFLAKEKGATKLTIPFSELKELADGDKNKDRFIKNLVNVNKKLIRLNHQIEIDNIIHVFSLFNTFSIDKDKNELVVQVNEIFSYMLNDLIGNFTKFDLLEFVSLKSSYSKNTFKLLKQWESINKKTFEIEEFKKLLGVPKSYTSTNFNERVLKPINEELPHVFCGFVLEKIKTGRKVTHLKFTWSNKKQKIKEVEKIEIEISDKLNKSIQKAKTNRFIEKLLNNDNIEILVNTFEENDLVRGLIWASKEIRRDISTLDYLIKTIKTGAERSEKKIVVKETIEEIKEVSEEKIEAQIVIDDQKKEILEKTKVTQAEYENLYQTYLKENNEKHNPYARKGFDIANRNKFEIIEEEKQEEKIYRYTVEELKSTPMEELIGKKIEIIDGTNSISKTTIQLNENFEVNVRFENIPEEKLLSKKGKMLKGGALLARLEKIARDEEKKIKYKDKIIGE